MSLRWKFNLILVITSLLGLAVAGWVSYNLFHQHAREEVMDTASLMMESALAVRSYTVNEIRPLIRQLETSKFIPQTVPAYAANQFVKHLQKNFSEFSYKEATLNPTNPANRASEWEVDVVQYFRNHENEKELIGDREAATGPILYISRPIKITNPGCLACHGKSAQAPKSLIDQYGDSNGFGWKIDDIVGAQIVSVPQSLALKRAMDEFYTFMATMVGIFLLVGVTLNLLLKKFVIGPVVRIAKHADDVSMGTLDLPELPAEGKDEMSLLARSFNRMQRSLIGAMGMLNTD